MDTSAAALAQLALLGEAVARMPGVAVFVWDDDRNYVAVNDAACELTGRTSEQLLSMRVGELTPDGGEPHFSRNQSVGVHNGRLAIEGPAGPVELEWITCHTTVAGLPYLVSICWRPPDGS
ncbi:MAG: PAS domain-containing protein [Gaiellaceae bacterium]